MGGGGLVVVMVLGAGEQGVGMVLGGREGVREARRDWVGKKWWGGGLRYLGW